MKLPEQIVTTPDGVVDYDLLFLNRMMDFAQGVHSLPEGAPDEYSQRKHYGYGADWARPVCDCTLYPYPHGGCPGPMAKHLPKGWKSGDELPGEQIDRELPLRTVKDALDFFARKRN